MASQKNSVVEKAVDHVDLVRRDFVPKEGARPRPLIMGIDPGLSGAIAVVDMDRGNLVDMMDLPTFKKKSDARAQGFLQFLDIHRLSSLIDMYAPHVALAVLEEPGAMPKQGLGSTFSFGHTCGQIHGVLAGHYIPVAPTKPAVWKSALALTNKKDDSRALATKIFPKFAGLWCLKGQNDRAEALLLTVYGQKYLSKVIKISR